MHVFPWHDVILWYAAEGDPNNDRYRVAQKKKIMIWEN